jgi:anthranilate/para-aminobenzoate synthase component I
MPLTAVVIDRTPDPVAIAQQFAQRPGFAFLHGASDGERGQRSFVAFDPVETSSSWLPPEHERRIVTHGVGNGAPLAAVGWPSELDSRRDVPQWIGAIPYECARGLERAAWTRSPDDRPAPHLEKPRWHRYEAVIDIDSARGLLRVVGDGAAKVAAVARELGAKPLPRRSGGAPRLDAHHDESPRAHVDRIRYAKELIRAGDLYQVNLARRQRFDVEGHPLDVYLAIAERAPAEYGACLDLGGTFVCASSPELFLAIEPAGWVTTTPIKGTRPRGGDANADAELYRELDENAKERAELTMILDVERNDLGKVCVPGSVRLLAGPRVTTHRTVHHRSARLGGVMRRDVTPLAVLRAMFPSGSVTGAPKVRAMEVIARLEPVRRGLYTGAFGRVTYGGSVALAMAIRVLTIQGLEAHYFAGGGIVADSDPEAELDETRWKGTQIERLVATPSMS